MNCPQCNTPKMIVTVTRDTEDNTYRKRKCTKCFFKITTVEVYSIANADAQMPQHRPNRTKK